MCGIAALISEGTHTPSTKKLYRMIENMRQRGDKPPSVRQVGRAVLGCSRLAIVGRDSGEQPLSDSDGSLTVVFNGEIYNHRELRAELKAAGYRFSTECDTEVLLHGYKHWGAGLPARLKGMYAFVVWDRAKGEFFAARDPFGIKPLYYAREKQQWAFSSQIYPLIDAGFRDIKYMEPGTHLLNERESEGALTPLLSPVALGEEAAKKELRRLISQSVRRHMETDLHVAVFLSGGIDSSIILYEAAEVRRRNLTAFCVGTPGCEDLKYAREVAAAVDVELRHVPVEQKTMVDNIPRAVAIIESFEPNHIRAGTASIALADFVSKERENFRVALVGEGADELFGGYQEFPDAVEDGLPDEDVRVLFRRFIYELHKTQLQRVDRTTMAYGIEARVPYLDLDLARFAMSLPTELKLGVADGKVWSKYILRQAYSGVLPKEVVWRRKVPMGEGAGIGDNGAHGPFHEYTRTVLTQEALEDIRQRYPEFEIKTAEEAYYFTIFVSRFGPLELARHRPLTNVKETRP